MTLLKPAVAISILAAMMMFLAFVPGQTQAHGPAPTAEPPGCAARSNPYVGEPTVSNTGRVTHDLTDMYGNSYNYNDNEGGWGRAKVLGYHVKSDGPHDWVWRAGTSTTISYGQVATACIEQKVKAYWGDGAIWTWKIVSPEVSRPQG